MIGTSLDLVVWTSNVRAAQCAEWAALEEVHRLTSILSTRDPDSEISGLGEFDDAARSRDLAAVLSAYDYWTARTGGIVSVHVARREHASQRGCARQGLRPALFNRPTYAFDEFSLCFFLSLIV